MDLNRIKNLLKNEKFWLVITAIFTALAAFSATYQTFITQKYNKKTMMPILTVNFDPSKKIIISNDGNGVARITDLYINEKKINEPTPSEIIKEYNNRGCKWTLIRANTPIRSDKNITLLDCSESKSIINSAEININIDYKDVYDEIYTYP